MPNNSPGTAQLITGDSGSIDGTSDGSDLWYRFTAPCTRTWYFTFNGLVAGISVFVASTMVQVPRNVDDDGFNLTQGVTYLIKISTDPGPFTFTWSIIPVCTEFEFTGDDQTLTIPLDSNAVDATFSIRGGGATNGAGAVVEGTFPVSPGDVITVKVGGVGTTVGGWPDGGDGGFLGAFQTLGGGGSTSLYRNGIRFAVAGGAGGGTDGGDPDGESATGSGGGQGGTQFAPGAGGAGSYAGYDGEDGDSDGLGFGGDGADAHDRVLLSTDTFDVTQDSAVVGGPSFDQYVSGPVDIEPFSLPPRATMEFHWLFHADDGGTGTTGNAYATFNAGGTSTVIGFISAIGGAFSGDLLAGTYQNTSYTTPEAVDTWMFNSFGIDPHVNQFRVDIYSEGTERGQGGGGGWHGGGGGGSIYESLAEITGGGGGSSNVLSFVTDVTYAVHFVEEIDGLATVCYTPHCFVIGTPLHIPHKDWSTQLEAQNYHEIERWSRDTTQHFYIPHKETLEDSRELDNYLAIERWVRDGMTYQLHIPHKDWATPNERENYLSIERWARINFP